MGYAPGISGHKISRCHQYLLNSFLGPTLYLIKFNRMQETNSRLLWTKQELAITYRAFNRTVNTMPPSSYLI